MKYCYVAGLEHSGTTLASQILSQSETHVALGEVAQFLNPVIMHAYQEKWGKTGSAIHCSCGKRWDICEFWSGIQDVWGIIDDVPKVDRYKKYFDWINKKFGSGITIVDSSKSLSGLKYIVDHIKYFSLELEEISIIHAVKDSRSFAQSMIRKQEKQVSLIQTIKYLNYWRGENAKIIDYASSKRLPFRTMFYEDICLGRKLDEISIFTKNKSEYRDHIILSNKNYLQGEDRKIRYDNAWFNNRNVNLAYILNPRVRKLNEYLYNTTEK